MNVLVQSYMGITIMKGIARMKKEQNITKSIKRIFFAVICSSTILLTGFADAEKSIPEVQLTKGEKITVNYNKAFNYKDYVSIANSDENVNVSVSGEVNTKKEGTYYLTIKAENIYGDFDQKTLQVTVDDISAPALTLSKSTLTLKYGAKFSAKSYIKSALDNKDGNLKSKVKITSKVKTTKPGTYTVKYSVADKSKNSVTKSMKVVVKKPDARQKIVIAAKSRLGCKYKWGATGPTRFDCSGLVRYCYKKAGKTVAHSSSTLKRRGKVISLSKAKPGDIVWRSGHVGVYVGNGKVIHSPSSGKRVSYTRLRSFRCAVRYYN